MKIYTIGRDTECNIVINDNTDVISRRHAILHVSSTGKMTITDFSQNGTFINGVRISSNVPVPVTRKDSVAFAQLARLEWSKIPKPTNILLYGIIAFLSLLIIILGLLFVLHPSDNKETGTADKDTEHLKQVEPARNRDNKHEIYDDGKDADASAATHQKPQMSGDDIYKLPELPESPVHGKKPKPVDRKDPKLKDDNKPDAKTNPIEEEPTEEKDTDLQKELENDNLKENEPSEDMPSDDSDLLFT